MLGEDTTSTPIELRVTDLAGSAPTMLVETVAKMRSDSSVSVYLVAPGYAYDVVERGLLSELPQPKAIFDGKTFGVHMDMDRLDQVVGVRWDRLGVGVWRMQ